LEIATADPVLRFTDLNAELLSAKALANGVEFVYQSSARAFALLDREPARLEIDGEVVEGLVEGKLLKLPRGQHLVTATLGPSTRSAQ
jgi:hypothetical protein